MSKAKVNTLESLDGTVSLDIKDLEQGNIQSGGDDIGGYWTKFPDGTLIMYGVYKTGVSVSGTPHLLPVRCVGQGSASGSHVGAFTSTSTGSISSLHWLSADGSQIFSKVMYNSGSTIVISSVDVSYQVIGRWK